MKIIQLNHIAIYVRDLDKSIGFYKNVLGLTELPRPAFNFPGAWFELGPGQEIHLIGNRDLELSLVRQNHFALKVISMKEAEKRLKEKGITYAGPKVRPDGVLQLFLQDPDGYFIELDEMRTNDT